MVCCRLAKIGQCDVPTTWSDFKQVVHFCGCVHCEGRMVMGALAAFVIRFAFLLDVAKFPAFEALQGTGDEFFDRESLVRYYH